MQHLFPRTGIVPSASPYYPTETDCMQYYALWSGSAQDRGPNGNDGNVIGGVFDGDNGLFFDKIDDLLLLPTPTTTWDIGLNDYTIYTWFKTTESGIIRIMSCYGKTIAHEMSYYLNNGSLIFQLYDIVNVYSYRSIGDITGLNDGNPHCIQLTIDRDAGLYISHNNVEVVSAAGPIQPTVDYTPFDAESTISAAAGNYPFGGNIMENLLFREFKTTTKRSDYYAFTKGRYGL